MTKAQLNIMMDLIMCINMTMWTSMHLIVIASGASPDHTMSIASLLAIVMAMTPAVILDHDPESRPVTCKVIPGVQQWHVYDDGFGVWDI